MDKKFIPYIIAAGILIVLVVAAVFLVYLPAVDELQAKRQELNQKTAQLNLVRAKVKELVKLQKDIKTMEEETAFLQSQIPDQPDIPGVVKLLEKTANENNVIVLNITFDSAPQPNPGTNPVIDTISCHMGIKGRYASIVGFLNALKTSTRLFGLKDISFSPNGEDGQELTTQFNLAFFSYDTKANPVPAQPKG